MRRWFIETVATFLAGVLMQAFAPRYLSWMCFIGALFLSFEGIRELAKKDWLGGKVRDIERKIGRPMSFILASFVGIVFAIVYWGIIERILPPPSVAKTEPIPVAQVAPQKPNAEGGHTTDSATAVKTTWVEIKEGPKVLVRFQWHGDNDNEDMELMNDGTESALNVQIDELQLGPLAAQFKPIPIIEKGQHIRISPLTVLALSPSRHPVGKPHLGAILRRAISDKNVKSVKGNLLQWTVRIMYRSASMKEGLESHYVIEYSRQEKNAVARYLGSGKPDTVTVYGPR